MAPIALLSSVRHEDGPYAWGTALGPAHGLAVAAGRPALGRLVDRVHQTLPNVVGAAVPAAVIATEAYGRLVAAFGVDTASGAALGGCLRGSWLAPTTAALLGLAPMAASGRSRRRATTRRWRPHEAVPPGDRTLPVAGTPAPTRLLPFARAVPHRRAPR
jgi:hypothetical protein